MTTNNNHYQLYLEKVKQLARTIVIKDSIIVESLNRWVLLYHGEDKVGNTPREWKYYRHLAGEYHSTDTKMYVSSLDTLDDILFSKENLKNHRATFRGYALGTRYYKELVARFPEQEILIRGILNPTDIDTAINADDGTILNFQKELVEFNEYSFIAKLQDWVYNYHGRWLSENYSFVEDLYKPLSSAIFYMAMVPAILAIRMDACGTNEAHSFHVAQFLASNGMLDFYLEHLTTSQALWLYRNIRYINRHAGMTDTFEWLIENVLTVRRVPIATYSMKHNEKSMQRALSPNVTFHRKELNLGYSQDSNDVISLERILRKEDPLARSNPEAREYDSETIMNSLELSLSSVVKTKLLDSTMIDYSGCDTYTLESVLLGHWLDHAVRGIYKTVINAVSPTTGERLPLSAKDAYVFMWYCFCMGMGIEIVNVPKLVGIHVLRIPTPTKEELMRLSFNNLVPTSVASDMLDQVPTLNTVISTEAFYKQTYKIYKCANKQRAYASWYEHMDTRGIVQNMAACFYQDKIYQLEPDGTSFKDWLSNRNIVIDGWTKEHFATMYGDILKDATGLSLKTIQSVEAMQRAMISLTLQLSSYTIQAAREINTSNITISDNPGIRVGDIGFKQAQENMLKIIVSRVQTVFGKFSQAVSVDFMSTLKGSSINARAGASYVVPLPPLINSDGFNISTRHVMCLANVRASLLNPKPTNGRDLVPVPGIDVYEKVPIEERHKFKDVYGNRWGVAGKQPVQINTIITKSRLDGLRFTQPNTNKEHMSLKTKVNDLSGFKSES